MMEIPRTSPSPLSIASGETVEKNETTNPAVSSGEGEGMLATIDPLAKFSALNGLHALVEQFVQNRPESRDPWGRRDPFDSNDAAPTRNGPVLYDNVDVPSHGNEIKSPPSQVVYDVDKTTQDQIDKLKAYPNGTTQADVDKLTRRDISRTDIEAMKASKNPKIREKGEALETARVQGDALEAQHRLGVTIENAKIAYKDLIAQGAKVYVTTSAGNGGQPVVVIKGPGFDDSKPARVHTHYHGDNATVADQAGSKAGTNYRISQSFGEDKQTVWVLPESVARPKAKVEWPQQPDGGGRDGYYTANWDNVQSEVQTTADALKAAGVGSKDAKYIVSFHSRGGEALINIMRDKSGSGLHADRLELLDCLYGSQYAAADWGKTANGKAAGRVIFYRGNLDASRADVISAQFPTPRGATVKRFEVIDVGAKYAEMKKKDPHIDDTINPLYEKNPGDKPRVRDYDVVTNRHGDKVKVPVMWRQFDRDPHYRTTGQFMGTEKGP